jgi:hypothetical protein
VNFWRSDSVPGPPSIFPIIGHVESCTASAFPCALRHRLRYNCALSFRRAGENEQKFHIRTLRRSSGAISVGGAPSIAIVDTAPLRASTKVRAQSKMARTRADFGRLSKRCKKRWTEWWREVNSNCRYRFLNCPDDSIMLEFATARRIALIARRLQYCRRYCGSARGSRWKMWRRCPKLAGSYKDNDIFPTCAKAGLN